MADPAPRTVLVVGGGGREHALAWALARSPSVRRVVVAPGNGGTATEPAVENAAVGSDDHPGLVDLAVSLKADLTVVGPEDPIGAGLCDRLRAAGCAVFGPSAAAARLETSKSWAREFMARHGIPHPRFRVVADLAAGRAAVDELGGRCVIKADGLAAGKGVVVADGPAQAERALEAMLVQGAFGAAGRRVVVEERLEGPELSVMAICDGHRYHLLPPAADHKRLLDGDEGPNTGGMGAYAPAPLATPDLLDSARRTIFGPAVEGLAAEGHPFVGCLYAGLIATPSGLAVIEFNARFGDPETEVQLPLLAGDLGGCLAAAAAGRLEESPPQATGMAAVTVVLASPGYPGTSEKGLAITAATAEPDVKVFHAGTTLSGGGPVTTGGRALAVTAWRAELTAAREAAYRAIGPGRVWFEGARYRSDIAARALAGS